jgi:diadenylate cyclase
MNPSISKRLGTRHRAALGIAEESDAIALVVSEENGRISIACDGELNYNLTLDEFRMLLVDAINPKPEVFYEAENKDSAGEE